MGPHPLPGLGLDGKAGAVDVEQHASLLLLLLPRRVVVDGRGRGGLVPGAAAAQEALGAGAFGPAVPAQFGRGGAGATRGGRTRHGAETHRREV